MGNNCMSSSNDDFAKEHLSVHNAYRSEHGCPPLKLDKKLCHLAQSWATRLAQQRTMEHRSNNEYGENLYMKGGTPPPVVDGRMPVVAWYDEIKYHTFSVSEYSSLAGHFTQVVWKETTKLGVGVAKNKHGETFVVTNYDPPGNVATKYNKNVPKKVK